MSKALQNIFLVKCIEYPRSNQISFGLGFDMKAIDDSNSSFLQCLSMCREKWPVHACEHLGKKKREKPTAESVVWGMQH